MNSTFPGGIAVRGASGLVHGKSRDLPSALALIEEAPLHPGTGVAPSAGARLPGGFRTTYGLAGELDALTDPIVHVELRKLPHRQAVQRRLQGGDVDLPVAVARCTGVAAESRTLS